LVALHQGAAGEAGVVTALLEVENLKKHFVADRSVFGRPTAFIKAVDGVSFHVEAGKTLALVGESGCGKSTVSRLVLRLIEPDAGGIRFEGRDLLALDANQLRAFRRDAQIIFQDPYASLNPRMTVSQILAEPLALHDLVPAPRRRERVEELLRLVGLEPRFARRYPHEFSGGQRQRIAIARALAVEPKLIICDEPVSALDVSIRSQILYLRQPRPCRRQTYRRPRRRDEPRRHRRNRRRGGAVRLAPPPLQPRAIVGDPGAQTAGKAQPHPVARRHAERAQSAVRLPLSYPLPLCDRALPRRDTATACRWHRPCHRLPPHGGTATG
jgi:ABC-type dipeptide/oligopeptide/nickel transport system ATPase subunit